jgi:hypothetical protein
VIVLPPDVQRALRQVLSDEQPFGPSDAALYTSMPDAHRVLYDSDNRIHQRAASNGAPFVIGRKGSGKTAFVMAPKLSDDVVALELPGADIYSGVFGAVRAIAARSEQMYTEQSATLWRHACWSAVLQMLASEIPAKSKGPERVVREFMHSLGSGRVPAAPEHAISCYLRRLHARIGDVGQLSGVAELLDGVEGDGHSIREAIEAGQAILSSAAYRLVVIVDSLERYSGPLPSRHVESVERTAFEGLFHFIGREGSRPDRPFDIRFAFPGELWPILERISTTPAKDFGRKVVAYWSARELIQMAGSRLALYSLAHGLGLWTGGAANHYQPLSYAEARQVLRRLLPATVTNGLGIAEDSIAYLMRHTQLLPRHVILLLNSIWEVHRASGSDELPVSNRAVVEGVRLAEIVIADDIAASYSSVHPLAHECCEKIIPNIRMSLTESELHQAYNRGGVKKLTGMDLDACRRMLAEIGCIGREIPGGETTRYVSGEFEYTVPGTLGIGSDDRMTLHPVFAEVYGCIDAKNGERSDSAGGTMTKAIYPYGSDPDAEGDYRDTALGS